MLPALVAEWIGFLVAGITSTSSNYSVDRIVFALIDFFSFFSPPQILSISWLVGVIAHFLGTENSHKTPALFFAPIAPGSIPSSTTSFLPHIFFGSKFAYFFGTTLTLSFFRILAVKCPPWCWE